MSNSPAPAPRGRLVSDLLVETLVNWGVQAFFGMVGHSNLALADAVRKEVAAGRARFVAIRHEGAASFAASAYGKLTGRLSACLTIAGPGATNLLTGLWDAHMDRSPVLALTGQVETQVLGPGAFQEVDLQAAFGRVAKWSQPVLSDSKHAELANLACKSALVNRGVSHLIIPDEVQKLPCPDEASAGRPAGRIPGQRIAPPSESVAQAVALLRKSRRPAIIVGHGARFEMAAVLELAELLACPVLTTFKGKGLIPDTHPLACGVLGRSGTAVAGALLKDADCLLAFGVSFSAHTGIKPDKPIIQVDLDPMTLGKFHAVEVPVWGEIGVTAGLMKDALDARVEAEDQRPAIGARQKAWRSEKERRRARPSRGGISSAVIFDALSRLVPEDAVITVDVGDNAYSFGRYFECARQAVLLSGYLGSIGFALPAALGAWVATREENSHFRDRKVVAVCGDGGFAQYMAELTTAVQLGTNITTVLLNNSQLGKITKEQRSGQWEIWQTALHNPDFARFASLCGALGIRVEAGSELETALARALAHNGASLVEIMSDPEQT